MSYNKITVDGVEKLVELNEAGTLAREVGPLSKKPTGHMYSVENGSVTIWSNDKCTNIQVGLEKVKI